MIRATGVKEFAARVRMASPNLLRAIDPRHNPTQATLDRLLKPFGLRLSLAPHQVQVSADRRVDAGRAAKDRRSGTRSEGMDAAGADSTLVLQGSDGWRRHRLNTSSA